MLLSVCLITYNHERTVRDALDSVLAQRTSYPFEVVAGDDASSDATPSILTEYADRHSERLRPRLHAVYGDWVLKLPFAQRGDTLYWPRSIPTRSPRRHAYGVRSPDSAPRA